VKEFLQQLINGISTGSQYALWTVGYGLVYQVLGLFNFAHGDTVVLPVYVCLTLVMTGVPFAIAAIAAILLGGAIAIGIERFAYRPLLRRNQSFLGFVAALAAAVLLESIEGIIWGTDTRSFPQAIPQTSFLIGGLRISSGAIINLGVAVTIVFLFELYLRKFRSGQAILAVAQDRSTAPLMGISVNRVVALVYGLSGAVGVIGSLLYITNVQSLQTGLGFSITLRAFIAAVLGGIGSVEGALLGGLALGVAESMIIGYLTTQYLNAILFTALGLFLVFRPTGLIGRREVAKL
jgi:branched-chain amino acid transport system permease protein